MLREKVAEIYVNVTSRRVHVENKRAVVVT